MVIQGVIVHFDFVWEGGATNHMFRASFTADPSIRFELGGVGPELRGLPSTCACVQILGPGLGCFHGASGCGGLVARFKLFGAECGRENVTQRTQMLYSLLMTGVGEDFLSIASCSIRYCRGLWMFAALVAKYCR